MEKPVGRPVFSWLESIFEIFALFFGELVDFDTLRSESKLSNFLVDIFWYGNQDFGS